MVKLFGVKISPFALFVLGFILVSFFKDKFPVQEISFGYILLALITMVILTNDVWELEAKDESGKIIGDESIHHSVLQSAFVDLPGDLRVHGIGGYSSGNNHLLTDKRQSEGLILAHKSLYNYQGSNVKVNGKILEIHFSQLKEFPQEWIDKLEDYFKIKLKEIKIVYPKNEWGYDITHNGVTHKDVEQVYLSLFANFTSVSQKYNFTRNTIQEIGKDVGGIVDKGAAWTQRAMKPFKKEFKLTQKQD